MLIFGYENYNGDSGVIIADSYEDACDIYRDRYRLRNPVSSYEELNNETGYVYELGDAKKGVYAIFEA